MKHFTVASGIEPGCLVTVHIGHLPWLKNDTMQLKLCCKSGRGEVVLLSVIPVYSKLTCTYDVRARLDPQPGPECSVGIYLPAPGWFLDVKQAPRI